MLRYRHAFCMAGEHTNTVLVNKLCTIYTILQVYSIYNISSVLVIIY